MSFDILALASAEAAQNFWAALSVAWGWFTLHAWPFIWEWVVIGILYKAIVAAYIGRILNDKLKNRLIKTREQIALYHHYKLQAMGKGHATDFKHCTDGMCAEINASKK